jgi:hypothetical protein
MSFQTKKEDNRMKHTDYYTLNDDDTYTIVSNYHKGYWKVDTMISEQILDNISSIVNNNPLLAWLDIGYSSDNKNKDIDRLSNNFNYQLMVSCRFAIKKVSTIPELYDMLEKVILSEGPKIATMITINELSKIEKPLTISEIEQKF